jgi:PKD repeat protein
MKSKITLFMTVVFTLIGLTSMAQTYIMGTSRTVTGCALTIYDNGGAAGNYGNNRNDTMTILSGTPGTPSVIITLVEGDVANDDSLFIYNSNTADPSRLVYLGPLNGAFFNNSNMVILGDWSTYATIDNPTGAITLRFKSNGANAGAGFKITTACQAPCQRINAFIDTVASYPQPKRLDPDDGHLYIDLCQDSSVHLVAKATFIDNNFAYPQSLDSCRFAWGLGDIDTTSLMGVTTINHTYLSGRGYDVILNIRDQRNCFNMNSAGIRIRTSVNPIAQVSPLADMCSGTTRLISVGYSDSSDVLVSPITSVQESSLSFDSTMYVPDGDNCPGMPACYNTYVTFNSFAPGAKITSAADILSVCFTMEHSFLGDLQFRVVCPTGLSTITHAQPNGSSLFLGVPIDGSNSCDASPAQRGVGWNYCWSEYPSYSYHGSAPNYLYLNQSGTSCDSSNRQNHTNYYKPMNSFSNLIGCDLNGTWSIEICDLWGIDDGWIFQWQLNLDPSLLPTPWSYTIGVNNVLWTGAFISQQSDSTALLAPSTGGLYDYTFSVIDDFGCAYDSIMHLEVIETPDPNLGSDTSFCNDGTILILDPHYGITNTTYRWSDATNDPTTAVLTPGTYMITVTNKNSTQTLSCYGYDTINVQYYPQPTANFSATPLEGCSPLLVQFTDESTPTGLNYTYAWDFGDPAAQVNTSAEQNPQHLYTQYGNFDVSLLVTTQDGCSATITKPGLITVHPTPKARFTPNPETASLSDNPTITFTNQTENFVLSETTWFWNFIDGTTSTDMNPSHTYTSPDDYNVYLVVRNSYGCKDSVFHTVIIEDELFIPNILTPDGDNNNDFLVIGNLNMNRDNVLKIYDRWGKKVYEKKNYNTTSLCKKSELIWTCEEVINADQGWNGEGCPDGVYYYTFHYEGVIKTVDKHGTITIVGSK